MSSGVLNSGAVVATHRNANLSSALKGPETECSIAPLRPRDSSLRCLFSFIEGLVTCFEGSLSAIGGKFDIERSRVGDAVASKMVSKQESEEKVAKEDFRSAMIFIEE